MEIMPWNLMGQHWALWSLELCSFKLYGFWLWFVNVFCLENDGQSQVLSWPNSIFRNIYLQAGISDDINIHLHQPSIHSSTLKVAVCYKAHRLSYSCQKISHLSPCPLLGVLNMGSYLSLSGIADTIWLEGRCVGRYHNYFLYKYCYESKAHKNNSLCLVIGQI